MADENVIEVSTWAQFEAALIGEEDGKVIHLIADIDFNDEHPGGMSTTLVPKRYSVYGNGHKIRNMHYIGDSYFIKATSSKHLAFYSADIENLITEPSDNTSYVFDYCDFNDCDLSMMLSGSIKLSYAIGRVGFSNCGIRINANYSEDASSWQILEIAATDCNLTLEGRYRQLTLRMTRSYIGGSIKYKENNSNTDRITFGNSVNSIITLGIDVQGTAHKLATGVTTCAIDTTVINVDNIYPTGMIQCTTEQIKSPTYLASQGFPIVPVVVGGE